MKAVIVEDEVLAAQNLERLLKSIDEAIDVVTILQNVDESIEWFSANMMPDVVFMDIHLADGDSFEIFNNVDIHSPVIFTTAYDQYALKAFEVNSIDYLLKPINKNNLERSLHKLQNFPLNNVNNSDMIGRIMKTINQAARTYKKSFLIPFKDKLIPISSDDIAYVYSQNKKALITSFNKREYTMDTSLEDFLKNLDPINFFRANRQFIISHKAVADLSMWFDGKLAINLILPTPERIIVSRARSGEFKKWYMRMDG